MEGRLTNLQLRASQNTIYVHLFGFLLNPKLLIICASNE